MLLQSSLLLSAVAAAGLAFPSVPAPAATVPRALPPEATFPPHHSTGLPGAASDTLTDRGTVTGRVFSQISGSVIEFAVVELIAGDRVISALSDRTGRYRLEDVPKGARLIRASALDHSELIVGVAVPPRGVVSLDLTLAVRPIELSPLSARATRAEEELGGASVLAAERRRATPAEAELRMMESSPGMAELGLLQIVRAAATPDPDNPESILYVRGATSDLKLVLLDGAPVYAPFHLGGLIEPFMPGALGYSRPYVGGAPARFDGGLSYILDLGSRSGRGDRIHTSGAVDMMSARGDVEGPLPGGSFLVGGRYIHGEGPDRFTGSDLPYAYGDALLRMDWEIGRTGRLLVTGFFNREGVELTRRDEPHVGLIAETTAEESGATAPPIRLGVDRFASWGNVAGSVRYLGRALESDLELTAALGEFRTSLPLAGETPLFIDGLARRMRLAGVLGREVGGARVEVGASFNRISLEHGAHTSANRANSTFRSRNAGESLGAHAEAILDVLPTVLVRGGLRADYFFADGIRVAPRFSVAWTFLKESELSIAAGRYHQRVLSPETLLSSEIGSFAEIMSDGPGAALTPTGPSALEVSSATHLVFGLNSRALERFTVGVEGYVKSFRELPASPDLETSGFDFWIHREIGDVNGWIGYSVAWYRPEFEGRKAVPRSLGRQLVTGGLSAHLVSGIGIDLSLAYGVSLPYTPIPQGENGGSGGSIDPVPGDTPALQLAVAASPELPDVRDSSPLTGAARGSYLRLDGTVYKTWVFNWSGVPISVSPYIRILNALDRRDGLFFQFDPDEDQTPVSLGAIPLVPLIGVRWGL